MMRALALTGAALLGSALLVSPVPAQAAWQYFSCASDNFAAQFRDVPKMETVKFTMPRHKDALSARSYTTTVDNIVYKMLVADYSDRVAFGASILEEALFQHTEADDHGLRNGKILGNDTARIEPVVRGATYGRRITMDYPNGQGRNLRPSISVTASSTRCRFRFYRRAATTVRRRARGSSSRWSSISLA